MQKKRAAGFNLIELLITLVIMAVLAGIAYPSYQNYVRQSRRSDAQSAIQQTANRLEKFFSFCNSYPTSANALTDSWPVTCPPVPPALVPNNVGLCPQGSACNDLSPDRHYQITVVVGNIAGSCSAAGADARCGYTITANPNGAGVTTRQQDDGRFRMDATGVKQWDKGDGGLFGHKWTDK